MDFDQSPVPEAPEAPGGSALVLVSVALFFIFCPFALLRASAVRISHELYIQSQCWEGTSYIQCWGVTRVT